MATIRHSIELQDRMTSQMERIQQSMGAAAHEAERNEEAVRKMQSAYDRASGATSTASVAQEQYIRKQEEMAQAQERMTPTMDKQTSVYQRYVGMVEMAAARAEAYRERLEAVTASIAGNEEALMRLNAVPMRERDYEAIGKLIEEQERLNLQYQQTQNQLRSAEIAHVNAFNRMSQATMQLNPLVNGLSQGISSIPGPLGQIGRVGVQALGQITAGAKAAQVGFIAMNAAATIGISLLIQLGVSAWQKYKQEQEEARRKAEELQRQAETAAAALETEIKAAEALISRYSAGMAGLVRNMSDNIREETVAYYERRSELENNVSQMEIYGMQLTNNWKESELLAEKTSRTAEEEERLLFLIARMNGMIPGLNKYIYDETGQLALQTDVVWELVDAYVALAQAKAQASAAEELMGEAYKRQMQAKKQIEDLEGQKGQYSDVYAAKELISPFLAQAGIPEDYLPSAMSQRMQFDTIEAIRKAGGNRTQEYINAFKLYMESGAGAYSGTEAINSAIRVQQATIAESQKEAEYWLNELQGLSKARMDAESVYEKYQLDTPTGAFDESAYMQSLKGIWDYWLDSDGDIGVKVNNKLSFKEEDIRMLHDVATRDNRPIYQHLTPSFAVSLNVDTVREEVDLEAAAEYLGASVLEAFNSSLDFPN